MVLGGDATSWGLGGQTCCTISKDGTWQAWDMDVDFERRAAARPIASGSYTPDGDTKAAICISPDRSVVAIGSGRVLTFFAVRTGESLPIIDAHPDGSINSIEFDSSGEYLLTCGGFDRKLSIWHNVPGKRELLVKLQAKLLNANTTSKARIQQRIDQVQSSIAGF